MTTIREYLLILLLLLAAATSLYWQFGKLLTGLTERTLTQVRVKR